MSVHTVTHKAHDINKIRTQDVRIEETVAFEGLCLSSSVLSGLKSAGFVRPSPVQLKAIPLGKVGLDLIVQAKSGTGKTCVFTVIALENLILQSKGLQVLVLAPTREIALQIAEVIKSVGCHMTGLICHVFIGGLPVTEDKKKFQKCHIAVGTPGRIKQMIEENVMCVKSIRLFILDEADKLFEGDFQDQINWIFSSLPNNKQVLALSATYPEYLAKHLQAYMRNPTFVRLNKSDPALFGIQQYYEEVKFHPLPQVQFDEKVKHLTKLLSSVSFQQCIIFSNYQMRAQSLSDVLVSEGWPATYVSGSQDQYQRISAMDKLKNMHCRVLITTDLTSRGIDMELVNLVVNLDLPLDHETYLHRIGRAGRFGSYGAAVSFTALGKEVQDLRKIVKKCNCTIKKLPDPLPDDLIQRGKDTEMDNFVTVEEIKAQSADVAFPPLCRENSNPGQNNLLRNISDSRQEGETDLNLLLHDEIETPCDVSPAVASEDVENYIIEEIGPEQNGSNDWSDALQNVCSLVTEIKNLYMSEAPDLNRIAMKSQSSRNGLSVIEDYDEFMVNYNDTDYIEWLSKPDDYRSCSLVDFIVGDEVIKLLVNIKEQSQRFLEEEKYSVCTESLEDSIIESEWLHCRQHTVKNDINNDDVEIGMTACLISKKEQRQIGESPPKSKNLLHRKFPNNRNVMGVGTVLQYLRDANDPREPENDQKTAYNHDRNIPRPQDQVPLVYDDGLHDISLPEVKDFSEYDQSYMYFEVLDSLQATTTNAEKENEYIQHHANDEPLSKLGTYDRDDYSLGKFELCNHSQKESTFTWIKGKDKAKVNFDKSGQPKRINQMKATNFRTETSKKSPKHKIHLIDSKCSIQGKSEKHSGRKRRNQQSQTPSGLDYLAYINSAYPFYVHSAFLGPAQYYMAAAGMHMQYAKYFQHLSYASYNHEKLLQCYKMQHSYIKNMTGR